LKAAWLVRDARGYLRLLGGLLRLGIGGALVSVMPLTQDLGGGLGSPGAGRMLAVACTLVALVLFVNGVWTVVRSVRDLARGERWLADSDGTGEAARRV